MNVFLFLHFVYTANVIKMIENFDFCENWLAEITIICLPRDAKSDQIENQIEYKPRIVQIVEICQINHIKFKSYHYMQELAILCFFYK